MGLCLSCCRKSKARFRDKGSKLCSTKHSAVSYSEEIVTNPEICLTTGIANDNSSTKLHKESMSNMIKGFVSKRRNRYKEDGFNLDLTYITDHIIAMGFPASNIEGVYRNNIDDVVRFFETKHKNHYKIYNLCSERSYDATKFQNRVEIFPFDDHNPPKIELIKPFCVNVDEWLQSHRDNVAVVHCKAGKGRTGTMICCYLLHSRHFLNAEEALNYYGSKRTQDRKGVTIPSQLRYVHYYAQIIQERLTYKAETLYIRKIKLEPPPNFAGGQGSVCFAISQQNLKEADGKCFQQCVKLLKSEVYEVKRCNVVFTMDLCVCTPISGDVKVEFYNKKLTKEKQFQFWVNTFFVVKDCPDPKNTGDLELVLRKCELDIVNKKDKQNKVFAEDFKVTVIFRRVPQQTKTWMATPPKQPPVKQANATTEALNTTPSESSEADTTEDDTGDDEDEWDSVLELDNVDPRAFGYRLLSESDLTFQLTSTTTTSTTTSSDQHTELLTA